MSCIDSWLDQFFDEVEPKAFYRDIFPEGELEHIGFFGQTGQYVGIILGISNVQKRQKAKKRVRADGSFEWIYQYEKDGSPKMEPVSHRYYLTDDLNILDKITVSDDLFCLMSPLSYAGRERSAANARFMYAMAFDVDMVRVRDGQPVGLMNFWNGHVLEAERLPMPTYMVSSGSGIHLYYVFDRPIPLFKNIVKQLQAMKHELTEMIWNESIVDIKSDKDIQYEGIFQGFRVPGTITKDGRRARAFESGPKVTVEYMNQFVRPQFQVTEYSYKSKLTLSEAQVLYPEWYQERIVDGKTGILRPWAVNRRLYDWWKREIMRKAEVGHRYYCLMILAAYAMKCSTYDAKKNPNPVTREELEADAFEVMEYFETLTKNEKNHFTASDVLDALDAFDQDMLTYPRNSVEYRAGFTLPKNKRNDHPNQAEHLEEARAIRDIRMRRRGKKWTDGNGRPVGSGTKEAAVLDWIQAHPDGSVTQAARELGISRTTVYKWWGK